MDGVESAQDSPSISKLEVIGNYILGIQYLTQARYWAAALLE